LHSSVKWTGTPSDGEVVPHPARAYEQGVFIPQTGFYDAYLPCDRIFVLFVQAPVGLCVHIDNIVQRQPNISSHEISFYREETVRFIVKFRYFDRFAQPSRL
jgi:hypothetical protein